MARATTLIGGLAPALATIASALLALLPAAARPLRPLDADLSRYLNRNRLLLTFAPSPADSRCAKQRAAIDGKSAGFKERDVIRFDVFENDTSRRGGEPLLVSDANALRQEFHVAAGQFKIVLVDKDGRTIYSATRPAPAPTLLAAIDATTVRRDELLARRTKGVAGSKASSAAKTALPPRPDKRLTPEQVVRFQMEALQHNDVPKPDSGIAITFGFASPENRQATGPLEHFTQIVKSPAYLPMLTCKKIVYEPVVTNGETASQRVRIIAADGARITYVFLLSLQKEGEYAGCWMNDGCVRDDAEDQNHRFDA
jgi:hypothetical protein